MDFLGALLIVLGVLALLVIILIFPAVRRHPERACFRNKYIAHRGLHGAEVAEAAGGRHVVPENSMEAFERAVDAGLPIETDIHVTADGEVVVFHDDTLRRMCGSGKRPEDMTLAELKSFRLAGTRQRIPTLKELLDLVDGRVPLLIEFKCTDRDTCELLCIRADAILDEYQGNFAVQSFYPFVLGWFRKNRPEVMRGQLASGFYRDSIARRLLGTLLLNCIGRPDFVSYDYKNRRNFFFRFCVLLGAMPLGWTFKKKQDLDDSRKFFKGYIFENEETIS